VYCWNYDLHISNCLIVGNRAYGANSGAIFCADSSLNVVNCTVSGNVATSAAIYSDQSDVAVSSSILWNNSPADLASLDLSRFSVTHSTLGQPWPGLAVIHDNPLFADVGYWSDADGLGVDMPSSQAEAMWINGDYHLQSVAGRWTPELGLWVQDSTTSPCVDAGDPNDWIGLETVPNGDLRNQGVYGGTAQASLTYGEGE